MRKIEKFMLLAVLLLGSSLSFMSCDKDDNKDKDEDNTSKTAVEVTFGNEPKWTSEYVAAIYSQVDGKLAVSLSAMKDTNSELENTLALSIADAKEGTFAINLMSSVMPYSSQLMDGTMTFEDLYGKINLGMFFKNDSTIYIAATGSINVTSLSTANAVMSGTFTMSCYDMADLMALVMTGNYMQIGTLPSTSMSGSFSNVPMLEESIVFDINQYKKLYQK